MTRRPPLALITILVVVGFLLVVTGTATSVATQSQAPRKQALIDQIMQQRRNVDDLDKAVVEVRGQVASARTDAGRASSQLRDKAKTQEELALEAGTTPVKGRGVVVKLSDAQRSPGQDSTKFDSSRIQDSDIQLVVNALFATGAEAVSINDNRVVAVTPIRAAGGTIVVNYRPVSSPYRISAIGVDDKRFKATDIAQHFAQWEKKFNLGFNVEKRRNVSIPAYAGRVGIDLAKPETGTTTTTTSTTSTTILAKASRKGR